MKKTAMIIVLIFCAALSVFAAKKEMESYASFRMDMPMASSKAVTSVSTTKTSYTYLGLSLQGANFLAEVADDMQVGVAYGIQFASIPLAGKSVTKTDYTDPIVLKFENDELEGQFFGALQLNVGGAFKYAIDKGLDALANVTLGMSFDSEKDSDTDSKVSTSAISFGFEGGAAYEVAEDISVTAGLGMQFGLGGKVKTTVAGVQLDPVDAAKFNTFYFFVGASYAY